MFVLVRFRLPGFPGFLHELPAEGLVLPVKDGGRFFVVFTLFPFANNTLFFNHALETLDRFLEVFGVVYDNMSHCKSPPSGMTVGIQLL